MKRPCTIVNSQPKYEKQTALRSVEKASCVAESEEICWVHSTEIFLDTATIRGVNSAVLFFLQFLASFFLIA